jgi:hypothetical protein
MSGMLQAGVIVAALWMGAPGQEAPAPDQAVQAQQGLMTQTRDRARDRLQVKDGTGDAVQAKLQTRTRDRLHARVGAGFVDADGDGIPDGGAAVGVRGTHRGRAMVKAQAGLRGDGAGQAATQRQGARRGGAGFVDADGDGVCDNPGAAAAARTGAGGVHGGGASGGVNGGGGGNGGGNGGR